MACHLPDLPVGAALPQQDVPLQAPACTQAEGLAVGKALHTTPVGCHSVQHLAPGQVRDFDGAVQRGADQTHFMYVGYLQQQLAA